MLEQCETEAQISKNSVILCVNIGDNKNVNKTTNGQNKSENKAKINQKITKNQVQWLEGWLQVVHQSEGCDDDCVKYWQCWSCDSEAEISDAWWMQCDDVIPYRLYACATLVRQFGTICTQGWPKATLCNHLQCLVPFYNTLQCSLHFYLVEWAIALHGMCESAWIFILKREELIHSVHVQCDIWNIKSYFLLPEYHGRPQWIYIIYIHIY